MTAGLRTPENAAAAVREDPFGTRSLIRLAAPLVVSVACFSLTLFTDRTLLMWYNPQSSGASMAAGNLYWTLVCVPVTAMGFVTPLIAAASVASSRRDRQPHNRMRRRARMASLVWQTLWITLATIPFLAIVALVATKVFAWAGHDPELAREEASYLRLLLWVAPASMLEAGLSGFFIGRRITGPILSINVATAAINVVLDVWLIFGGLGLPPMGIAGAAIATAVAMWFKAIVYLIMIARSRSFRLGTAARIGAATRLGTAAHAEPSDQGVNHFAWQPSVRIAGQIFVPGSTLGVGQLVRSTLMSFVLVNIGAVSVLGLAASTAAMSLYQFVAIPMIGLATAVTVMASQAKAVGDGVSNRHALAGEPRIAWSIVVRGVRLASLYTGLLAAVMIFAP